MRSQNRKCVVTILALGTWVIGCQARPSPTEVREKAQRAKQEAGDKATEQALRDSQVPVRGWTGKGGVRFFGPQQGPVADGSSPGRDHASPKAGPKSLLSRLISRRTRNCAGSNPEKPGYGRTLAGWPKFSYRRPNVNATVCVGFQLSWKK